MYTIDLNCRDVYLESGWLIVGDCRGDFFFFFSIIIIILYIYILFPLHSQFAGLDYKLLLAEISHQGPDTAMLWFTTSASSLGGITYPDCRDAIHPFIHYSEFALPWTPTCIVV